MKIMQPFYLSIRPVSYLEYFIFNIQPLVYQDLYNSMIIVPNSMDFSLKRNIRLFPNYKFVFLEFSNYFCGLHTCMMKIIPIISIK